MSWLLLYTIILQLLQMVSCTQPTHVDHMCNGGTSIYEAGMGSGTITFDGTLCSLTITDIPDLSYYRSGHVNRLNIVGVRSGSCDLTESVLIDSQTYCVDGSVKDTVINVTNQRMDFSLTYVHEQSFTLRYYTRKI